MKNALATIGVFALILIGLYFLVYMPDIKEAHDKGRAECLENKDTTYIPGDTVYVYRDTSFHWEDQTPATTTPAGKKVAKFDSSLVSNNDTISVQAEVEYDPVGDIIEWSMNLDHKDYYSTRVDTLKIVQTVEVPVIETVINWTLVLIAYISGIATAIVIFLIK